MPFVPAFGSISTAATCAAPWNRSARRRRGAGARRTPPRSRCRTDSDMHTAAMRARLRMPAHRPDDWCGCRRTTPWSRSSRRDMSGRERRSCRAGLRDAWRAAWSSRATARITAPRTWRWRCRAIRARNNRSMPHAFGVEHVPPPYAYRCPFGSRDADECGTRAAAAVGELHRCARRGQRRRRDDGAERGHQRHRRAGQLLAAASRDPRSAASI